MVSVGPDREKIGAMDRATVRGTVEGDAVSAVARGSAADVVGVTGTLIAGHRTAKGAARYNGGGGAKPIVADAVTVSPARDGAVARGSAVVSMDPAATAVCGTLAACVVRAADTAGTAIAASSDGGHGAGSSVKSMHAGHDVTLRNSIAVRAAGSYGSESATRAKIGVVSVFPRGMVPRNGATLKRDRVARTDRVRAIVGVYIGCPHGIILKLQFDRARRVFWQVGNDNRGFADHSGGGRAVTGVSLPECGAGEQKEDRKLQEAGQVRGETVPGNGMSHKGGCSGVVGCGKEGVEETWKREKALGLPERGVDLQGNG